MMRYELARLAWQVASRPRGVTLRPIEPTAALAQELAAIYLDVVKEWTAAVKATILPAYAEALLAKPTLDRGIADDVGPIERAMESTEETLSRLVLPLNPRLSRWALRVERWHRQKFEAAVKAGTGVDVAPFVSGAGGEAAIRLSVAKNIELIRSVSDQTRHRIANVLWRGYEQKLPIAEIAKQINVATKLSRDRAWRIASDQTVKLAAQLDRDRQAEAGIEDFKWRHSGKVHFRPKHKARDGKIYSWAKNDLQGDLPGVAPFCGCKAQAHVVIEDN